MHFCALSQPRIQSWTPYPNHCSAFRLKSKDMGHFTPCEWPALINLVMLESLLAFVGVSATRWWLLLSGPLTGSSLCKMTELGKDDK